MTTNEDLFTLHRYFLWANRHRDEFLSRVANTGLPPEDIEELKHWVRANFVNGAPWLASLYVIVEGWHDLNLSDEVIDGLLTPTHVDSLRRFRNGVFHFQKNYFDDRFLGLLNSNGPEWAVKLHREFGRFFKSWFETRGISVEFSEDAEGNEVVTVVTPSKTEAP